MSHDNVDYHLAHAIEDLVAYDRECLGRIGLHKSHINIKCLSRTELYLMPALCKIQNEQRYVHDTRHQCTYSRTSNSHLGSTKFTIDQHKIYTKVE